MSASPRRTEYSFTLPVGYVDAEGVEHHEGAMRLATARDEIEPLRDARVRDNGAYLSVLKLARVLTRVGNIEPVTPALVEQLYAADFAHLKHLYEQLNSVSPAPTATTTVAPQRVAPPPASPSSSAPRQVTPAPPAVVAPPPAPVPPASSRPPALAGVSDAAMRWMLDDGAATLGQAGRADFELPIGLRQDRERAMAREALMRSPAAPRRGRVLEGPDTYPHTPPPDAHAHAPSRGTSEHEPSGARLMRFGTRPPAHSAEPPTPGHPTERSPAPPSPVTGEDLEDIYEQMIARLRRELLVERERMGTSPGE